MEYNDENEDIKAKMSFAEYNKIFISLKELLDSIESRTHFVKSVFNPFIERLENGKKLSEDIETKVKVKI